MSDTENFHQLHAPAPKPEKEKEDRKDDEE